MDMEQRLMDLKLKVIRSQVDNLDESNGFNTRNWSTSQPPQQQQQYSNPSQYQFPSIQPIRQQQQTYFQQQPYVAPAVQPMQPMFLPDTNSQYRKQQQKKQQRRRELQRRRNRQQQEQEQSNRMMMQMAQVAANSRGGGEGGGGGNGNGNGRKQPREDALMSRLDRVLDQNTKLIEGIAQSGRNNNRSSRRKQRQNKRHDSSSDEDDHYSPRESNGNGRQQHHQQHRRQISWKQGQSSVQSYDTPPNLNSNDLTSHQPQQQQMHPTQTIDGQTIDPNNPDQSFVEIEGGSPALQNAKKWFVARAVTSSSLNMGASTTNLMELDLESDEEDIDDDEIDFKGKYSKRRRSNVAVIIVRILFIGSFLFCCLLLNHSFSTDPNSVY